MLKGVDISHWQTGLQLSKLSPKPDFVIAKATEGLNYVDATCNKFIEQAKAINACIGYYHFARANSGKLEAKFFYERTKNYLGFANPVLDYEDSTLLNNKALGQQYIKDFINEFYKLSGVYPMIYCSASICKMVPSEVASKCALWVAGYPSTKKNTFYSYSSFAMPYNIAPWKTAAIWQFTGTGRMNGYGANLDLNLGNFKRENWLALCRQTKTKESDIKCACRVILGDYGNGSERKQKLSAAGYDYKTIQNLVNKILEL